MEANRDRKKDLIPPTRTKADIAHSVVEAAISITPIFGGAISKAFAEILTLPLTKRQQEWQQAIVESIYALQEKVDGFSLESLKGNEMFVSTLIHATRMALRTHREEKREALRNAVLNSAIDHSLDDDHQVIFLSFVDDFTPWHLQILQFFHDPVEGIREKGLTLSDYTEMGRALDAAFSVLKEKAPVLYEQVVKDLADCGLINFGLYRGRMPLPHTIQQQTTDMGELFLRFISEPPIGTESETESWVKRRKPLV